MWFVVVLALSAGNSTSGRTTWIANRRKYFSHWHLLILGSAGPVRRDFWWAFVTRQILVGLCYPAPSGFWSPDHGPYAESPVKVPSNFGGPVSPGSVGIMVPGSWSVGIQAPSNFGRMIPAPSVRLMARRTGENGRRPNGTGRNVDIPSHRLPNH